MYLLGNFMPDKQLVWMALTTFRGISHATAKRICCRLMLHERMTVSALSEAQITQLSAYISSPSTIPSRPPQVTSPFPGVRAPIPATDNDALLPESQRKSWEADSLRSLVLESDLRRLIQSNLSHHRTIGSYVGRRHVNGLPVRGQRTKSNAKTSRKLNRIDRRAMSTMAGSRMRSGSTSVSDLVQPLLHLRFHHT